MHTESVEIIDIECKPMGEVTESIHESIRQTRESIQWLTPGEARHRTRLDKTPFQRAMTELTQGHKIPVSVLRRGEARNTRYSSVAIDLIKALKSQDVEALEELKKSFVPSPVVALAVAGEHTITFGRRVDEYAQQVSGEADALAIQVRETLIKIAQQNQDARTATATLSEAQKTAAKNRGVAQALQIVAAEQEAREESLAQFRSMGLGG